MFLARNRCVEAALPLAEPHREGQGFVSEGTCDRNYLQLAWTPKVCKIMVFWATCRSSVPLLLYVLLGSRYWSVPLN